MSYHISNALDNLIKGAKMSTGTLIYSLSLYCPPPSCLDLDLEESEDHKYTLNLDVINVF